MLDKLPFETLGRVKVLLLYRKDQNQTFSVINKISLKLNNNPTRRAFSAIFSHIVSHWQRCRLATDTGIVCR